MKYTIQRDMGRTECFTRNHFGKLKVTKLHSGSMMYAKLHWGKDTEGRDKPKVMTVSVELSQTSALFILDDGKNIIIIGRNHCLKKVPECFSSVLFNFDHP